MTLFLWFFGICTFLAIVLKLDGVDTLDAFVDKHFGTHFDDRF